MKCRCIVCNRKFHSDELIGDMCESCRHARRDEFSTRELQRIEEDVLKKYGYLEDADEDEFENFS